MDAYKLINIWLTDFDVLPDVNTDLYVFFLWQKIIQISPFVQLHLPCFSIAGC